MTLVGKTTLISIAFLFCCMQIAAQEENCEQMLIHATDEFNAGHFYSIPSILGECLSKFSNEQKVRANLLLTQTYLLLDDSRGARRSYLEVLKANPEFIADENSLPVDVVYLSKKFKSTPVFSWLLKGGANVSPIRLIYDLDAYGDATVREKYYLGLGYQVALGGEFYFTDHLSFRAELDYVITSYRHKTFEYFDGDTKQFTDRQNWFAIPLSIVFGDDIGKYRPYSYAGFSPQYLLSDVAHIEIVKVEANENDPQESPDIDFKSRRNSFNQNIFVGGGIKIKLGLDFLFIDARYGIGLKNVVNPKGTYADYGKTPTSQSFLESLEPAIGYGHVDDYFRMDNISISFGFMRPLYRPREIKRARTKGVYRSIKKTENEKATD